MYTYGLCPPSLHQFEWPDDSDYLAGRPEFKAYQKTLRLESIDVILSEKIDGTNAVINIDTDGNVLAGSRTRWLVDDGSNKWDNYGFGKWVAKNGAELGKLPPGTHYGEWYGKGINRNYGMTDRKLMLFNAPRYIGLQQSGLLPSCVELETVIHTCGPLDLYDHIEFFKQEAEDRGSWHVPGFMKVEGLIVRIPKVDKVFKVVWDK